MSAVPAPETGPDAGAVWHYGDPLGEQRAAADDAVVVDRSHRAVLTLTGGDRKRWLHSISTQHVSDLPDGAVTENLSLDGQGRVEDHWIQTELGGVTYLDTEPWRGEPLLAYLRKMVFWADVAVEPADLAVLSLLGPAAGRHAGARRARHRFATGGRAAVRARRRRIPAPHAGPGHRAGPRRAPRTGRPVAGPADRGGGAARRASGPTRRTGWRRCGPGSAWTPTSAPSRTRWAGSARAVHLDKGCYRGQETVARVHNLGKPPRMLVLLHLDGSTDRPATGDPVLAGGRAVGRLGTVVDHVDDGPIALALLKRGLPADTALTTGGEIEVAAVIDADSMPAADVTGAGRLAVERLRGGAR